MNKDNIGDRMKRYEKVFDFKLAPRIPLFIRVDGKAFHTYTKGFNKPYDNKLITAMFTAARKTAREMQGFKLAYVQSDECTFMLTDYDNLDTQGWFNYELNKVVSLTAAYFTAYFNECMATDKIAVFDARAYSIPESDWPNMFVWRQQDWERNSLQMLARAHYSHAELEHKNTSQLHELLYKKGINWANLKPIYKNGTFIVKGSKADIADYGLFHGKLTYNELVEFVGLEV